MKSTEPTIVLSTIQSVDIDESKDSAHRPLAPLASSETFTDVNSIVRDDLVKRDSSVSAYDKNLNTNHHPSRTTTKSEFDSLEILFDFPSSGISNEVDLDFVHPLHTPSHIRFTENEQVVTTTTTTSTTVKVSSMDTHAGLVDGDLR